uniref:Cytochrome c oxidase subunit 3 n=1 Tax=Utterbackia peninsularis TaxID=872316 RepID=F4ZG83_9BIVA|nr:cytochrome c oxidase subunit III [Utterbackia peninsularis]ADL62593.1 cytochrome c oxidase subunit III [Utterbackia peninsularis]
MRSPFHVLESSPWPFLCSISSLYIAIGLVDWMNGGSLQFLVFSSVLLSLVLYQWWRDVVRESNQGWHTSYVVKGIRLGMMLFIISEVFFFFSFFWAFFSCSLVPSVEIGGVWPPVGIMPLNPFSLPLLSTAVLLGSGVSVTWCHYALMAGYRKEAIYGLVTTILLGIYFTFLQVSEYMECVFTIADSVYGSLFYVMTGFHGVHVIVGTTMLLVMLFRLCNNSFSSERHLGLEISIWYWHFVDAVWIFLYLCVYWWGGSV